jgi:hypothetical protein
MRAGSRSDRTESAFRASPFESDDIVQQDINSTVMFHPEFLGELLDLGERYAARYADQVATLLEP